MTSSRRDFLKTAGLVVGAATLPSWAFEVEAAEAAEPGLNAPAAPEFPAAPAQNPPAAGRGQQAVFLGLARPSLGLPDIFTFDQPGWAAACPTNPAGARSRT